MHSIIIRGKISNSFQLMGAMAAQKKMAEKYGTPVSLSLTYTKYWNKKNISEDLLKFIDETNSSNRHNSVDIFTLTLNNPKPFGTNQLIIDDGLGAYRKDPFAFLSTINRERRFNGQNELPPLFTAAWLATICAKMIASLFHPGHVSIFKKTPWAYFKIDQDHKRYFIEAISDLSRITSTPNQDLPSNSILFLSQPPALIGFTRSQDYHIFITRLIDHCKESMPGSLISIKKHPLDEFDYSRLGMHVIVDEGVPAEIYIQRNKSNIKYLLGFTSTSLLTGKILFDIPAFFIDRNPGSSLSGDFWVDRGLRQHLAPLQVAMPK
ncbi:polysialyltransferase family glycosyltransferase [Ottowia oryzae]